MRTRAFLRIAFAFAVAGFVVSTASSAPVKPGRLQPHPEAINGVGQ